MNSAAKPAECATQVRLRKVFYIPGFDPAPPRRYRELYRKEGRAQANISRYGIDITSHPAKGAFGWNVSAQMDGIEVQTEFKVLVWSDIVQTSMDRGIAATYVQFVRTAWAYIASGALFRLMRLRKGPLVAALYPFAMLAMQLGVAVIMALVLIFAMMTLMPLPLAAFAGLFAGALILRWFRAQDHRFFAYYLMHDFAFTAGAKGAYPSALEARLADFGAAIRAAMADNCDEVLVVGHSSGAHLAVSVLADLIRKGLPDNRPSLGLLSLGQVMPMVSFLPEARRLRGDLHLLCGSDALTWVDVTAPSDGCAFALCDPVAVSGVAAAGKRWPLVISAAFSQTLSPARFKQLRWRFFRLHFQYLCAFDRPGIYDYFRITAGPKTLTAHFAGSQPSKNRIELPTSAYTSTLP